MKSRLISMKILPSHHDVTEALICGLELRRKNAGTHAVAESFNSLARASMKNNRGKNIPFAIEPFADFKMNIARALELHCLFRWID